MKEKMIRDLLCAMFFFSSVGIHAETIELICKNEQGGEMEPLKIDIEKRNAQWNKTTGYRLVGNVEKFLTIKTNDALYEGGWTMIIDRSNGEFFIAAATTLYGKVWGYTNKGTCSIKKF